MNSPDLYRFRLSSVSLMIRALHNHGNRIIIDLGMKNTDLRMVAQPFKRRAASFAATMAKLSGTPALVSPQPSVTTRINCPLSAWRRG